MGKILKIKFTYTKLLVVTCRRAQGGQPQGGQGLALRDELKVVPASALL